MAAHGLLGARVVACCLGFWSASVVSDYFLPIFDVATGSFLMANEERIRVW